MNLVNHATYSQADYDVQRVGDYLVVPVVMMTEGVRSGSGGAILHLEEHYSQSASDWNGIPVTAGHPKQDGQFVSVNAVSEDQWIVGHLKDCRAEDGKLMANVWIHEQRAIAVNPEVVNYIIEGKKLEVSIGAFTQDAPKSGEYEGDQYEAVTLNYSPDHLALLPGLSGACSWSDGCGIRNNEENMTYEEIKEAIKEGKYVMDFLQNNQVGFLELSSEIQTMLDRFDSEAKMHFLKEIFDDVFIYKVRNKQRGTERYYQQEYSTNEAGEVELEGQPQEVRRNVEFIPLQDNEDEDCDCKDSRVFNNNNNSTEEEIMSDENKQKLPSSTVITKAQNLINNEQTRFDGSDRDWLLQLNESQLIKLEPVEAEEPEITQEQAVQALTDQGVLGDIDKVKEILPEDTAEQIETGLDAYTQIREKLTKSIQTNSEEWEEDDLEEMNLTTLQKIEKSVRPKDYSGRAPVNNVTTNGEQAEVEPLYPAGIDVG